MGLQGTQEIKICWRDSCQVGGSDTQNRWNNHDSVTSRAGESRSLIFSDHMLRRMNKTSFWRGGSQMHRYVRWCLSKKSTERSAGTWASPGEYTSLDPPCTCRDKCWLRSYMPELSLNSSAECESNPTSLQCAPVRSQGLNVRLRFMSNC